MMDALLWGLTTSTQKDAAGMLMAAYILPAQFADSGLTVGRHRAKWQPHCSVCALHAPDAAIPQEFMRFEQNACAPSPFGTCCL